jgi:ankyrin repeat protein
MSTGKKLIIILALLSMVVGCRTTTQKFIVAASDGDLTKVKSMLGENPWLVNAMDIDYATATAQSARGESAHIGWTALHSAANQDRLEVARLLIARGANVNVFDERDYTPLKIAVNGGYREMVELLIAHGALINPIDTIGMSPLHFAAAGGHGEIAKILIAKGAIVNAQTRDYTRRTALATVSGSMYSERYVSSRKIIEGRTPLHLAAANGQKEMAELLIASGAKVDIRDNNGNTILHFAATYNHRNVAEVLVSKGAGINVRGGNGATPLHVAAARGNKEVAEFLVSKGAEINAKNESGFTALSVAIKNKHNDVADYLRKQGGVE